MNTPTMISRHDASLNDCRATKDITDLRTLRRQSTELYTLLFISDIEPLTNNSTTATQLSKYFICFN